MLTGMTGKDALKEGIRRKTVNHKNRDLKTQHLKKCDEEDASNCLEYIAPV